MRNYVSADIVRVEAWDNNSGLAAIFVSHRRYDGFFTPFTRHNSSPILLIEEGEYQIFAINEANIQSNRRIIIVDRTSPEVSIYADGERIESGSHTNSRTAFFSAWDFYGYRKYISRNGGEFELLSYLDYLDEGFYRFFAVDNAGNRTGYYYLTVDFTPPVGRIYAGNTVIESGSITNAPFVTFTATDNFAVGGLYVKLPGASVFIAFAEGKQFTQDGR